MKVLSVEGARNWGEGGGGGGGVCGRCRMYMTLTLYCVWPLELFMHHI